MTVKETGLDLRSQHNLMNWHFTQKTCFLCSADKIRSRILRKKWWEIIFTLQLYMHITYGWHEFLLKFKQFLEGKWPSEDIRIKYAKKKTLWFIVLIVQKFKCIQMRNLQKVHKSAYYKKVWISKNVISWVIVSFNSAFIFIF